MSVKSIEEIYPLTIVNCRYKDRIIIFNASNDADYISTAVGNEEVSYRLESWLEETLPSYGVKYGIGKDIWSAFEDYKERNKENK